MTTLVNRAKMTTATTGTGTITLGSASLGYQTFAAAGVNNGNVVSYVIEDGANWEIGRGTYTSTGTTLTRAVIQSSNAGSPITLSGSAVVFISAIDFDIVPYDKDSGTPYIAIADGGTGANTAANARTSLGLGTIATQNANAVAVTGGTINGTTVGATTAAAVNATVVNVGSTTAAVSASVTLNSGTADSTQISRSTGGLGVLSHTGSGALQVSVVSTQPIQIFTSNTERFRIGAFGQFGIGGANYGTSGQALVSGGSGAAPAWGTLPVSGGGTGVSTLTGYVKGSGTSPLTASATIPSSDISGLGTMATQNANAVAITGGSADLTGVSSVTVNSASPALTINQTGAGAAFLVEDDTSPDSTPFIVGATGSVGIGTSTLTGLLNLYAASNSTLYLTGDAATAAVVSRASSDASAANINFRKFRGSTAAPAAVTSGDLVGVTNYTAWDGVTLRATAQIVGAVDTFTGSDNVSGVLTFHTRPTGAAAALTERLRIGPDGNVTFKNAITETIFALTGTTPALSAANGTIQTWTLTANSTPTDSLSNGQSITLLIDDGTAYTITWPSVTWKTNGGVAPTLNTTGVTVIVLWEVGGVLYGARVGDA